MPEDGPEGRTRGPGAGGPDDEPRAGAGGPDDEPHAGAGEPDDEPLTDGVVRDAERLTRLARDATTAAEADAVRARRAELLGAESYTARVRDEDATLVLHPRSWLDEAGSVDVSAVDDLDRAVEVPLDGAGDADEWAAVAERNDAVAERIRAEHGDVHGDTAAAFAAFMSNHYARRVEAAGRREVTEFREEYFPRNAWPSDAQLAALERSLRLVFAEAGREEPLPL